MRTRLINIGFGNYLARDRIVAIAGPNSAPIKRSVLDARAKELVITLTNGRRTKSVIFTDSKYMVLSALEPVTIRQRVTGIIRRGG